MRQLEYVLAVAELGRFGAAAERLNVSQPSLSAQISDAEAQLGAVLFERGRTGALLTPVGHEVVRRARVVLRQMEDLKSAALGGGQGLSGRIRLGVLPTVGPYLLPRCTARLHAEFPSLRLMIRDEPSIRLQEHLADGQLDAVISTPEDHPGCAHRTLFEEGLWAGLPLEDELSAGSGPIESRELSGHALLTLGLGHRLTAMVQDLAARAEAFISTDYQGTSLDAIRHMAALGAGTAVLPELYVRCEAMRDAALCFRPIADPSARRRIALCWRTSSPIAEGLEQLAIVLSEAGQQAMK
ncbi:hydrogen peroxide-inducible genes activator [Maricaulis sp. CAU 1757]